MHGKSDDLRPWEHVKVTYYGRVAEKDVVLVDEMGHHMEAEGSVKALGSFIEKILGQKAKL